MKKLLFIIIALLSVNSAVYGDGIDSYINILRSDVRTQKRAIIKNAMDFTKEESTAFWPEQKNYELELNKLSDERMELINYYVDNYDIMTDKKANVVVNKSFKLEEKRTKLKKKYFKKLKKVIPSTKAAAFIQLETQIERMIGLQISSQLPLIK